MPGTEDRAVVGEVLDALEGIEDLGVGLFSEGFDDACVELVFAKVDEGPHAGGNACGEVVRHAVVVVRLDGQGQYNFSNQHQFNLCTRLRNN